MSKQETRSVRAELRAESGFKLAGIAASTGTVARIGNFEETIAKGCFSRAIREKQNVFCLREHSPNHVLGATKSGTLSLSETEDGSLAFLCQLDPRQSSHVDLWNAVQRKDLDSCSYAFSVNGDGGEEWRNQGPGKPPLRVLKDVDLFDVSIVCHPAGKGTSVVARSVDYVPAVRTLAAPSLAFLKKEMLRQRCEIFRDWHASGGKFKFVGNEETGEGQFEIVTDAELDQIHRAKARIIGAQIAAERRAESECECDCTPCRKGDCTECEQGEECDAPGCDHEEQDQ